MHHILFALGCFYLLAVLSNAAMNMGVHISDCLSLADFGCSHKGPFSFRIQSTCFKISIVNTVELFLSPGKY